jgi:hypothetical protein
LREEWGVDGQVIGFDLIDVVLSKLVKKKISSSICNSVRANHCRFRIEKLS